jgi:hypothetical protein
MIRQSTASPFDGVEIGSIVQQTRHVEPIKTSGSETQAYPTALTVLVIAALVLFLLNG